MIARRCWYNKSWWWGGGAFGLDPQFFVPFQVRLSRYICYFHRVADDLEDIVHMIHFHPSSRLVEVGAFCCMGYYGEVCPTWLFCAILRKKQQQSASWWVTRHPRDSASDNWQLPVPRRPATVILKWCTQARWAHNFWKERIITDSITAVSLFRLTPCERSSESSLITTAMRQTWRSSLLSFPPSHGISWRFSVEVLQKKSIIHFKFSKWFVQAKSSTTCFWTNCVFFLPPKFTCLACEVRTSHFFISREARRNTRGG